MTTLELLVKNFQGKDLTEKEINQVNEAIEVDYKNITIEQLERIFKDKCDTIEMLNNYLSDLHNLVPRSDAQRSRILDVEDLISKLQK